MTNKYILLLLIIASIVLIVLTYVNTLESKEIITMNNTNTNNTPQFWCALSPQQLEQAKQNLSQQANYITQQDGTERPFQNAYWNHKQTGIYVDIVSGEPLFSSLDKFDSGTGWPSFSKPLTTDQIIEKTDTSLGIKRTEVRSAIADSHLGHVFTDGPAPTGLRYCINSAALKFIPKDQLQAAGYAEFLPLFTQQTNTVSNTDIAILAGGCFWGMEELYRHLNGVIDTNVGYTGGQTKNATYDTVKTGTSGHAESLRIEFDPTIISYETILKFFFKIHDPTTLNQQGNDKGTQYRSAIFYQSPDQQAIAKKVISLAQQSGHFKQPIVTQVQQATPFYVAEEFHQDYLQKYPNGYTCHFIRNDINL